MATTCKLIAKVEVGSGGAANIEFTSIPGTPYTDLYVTLSGRTTRTGVNYENVTVEFNGNASNYSHRSLYTINGTSVASFTGAGTGYAMHACPDSHTANTFGSSECYIPNYAGSTNKSVSGIGVAENNATAATIIAYAMLWANTAAITSLKLIPEVGSFKQYSTAQLYGITKA